MNVSPEAAMTLAVRSQESTSKALETATTRAVMSQTLKSESPEAAMTTK